MSAAAPDVPQGRSRLIVGLLVLVMGLVILGPNLWPLVKYAAATRGEAVTARWTGSETAHSSRDTVGVPTFAYERRIGPMVQDCRVPLLRYRHAPDGKPLHETLQVVPGTTCDDIVILDDPPRERVPLAILGFLIAAAGAALTAIAVRSPR